MHESEKGQVTAKAAEVYEEFFVPALFEQWPSRLARAAKLQAGQRVLDVACGTGILARTIINQIGAAGSVIGLDVNPAMLAVARRKSPHIEWQQGAAEALPFADKSFDAVVSQFGLMFFEDAPAAIREMVRVLRPGGHLVVAVWAALESSPGYAAMVSLLQRLFGERVAEALRAPYKLGDTEALHSLFAGAGYPQIEITTQDGTACFPSIQSWVYTDIKGWTLANMLDEIQYQHLLAEAEQVLQPFVSLQGSVSFKAPAHFVTLSKD